MNVKKEIIEKVIDETTVKEKIDEIFSEIEEQAKEKLITELEDAARKKLEQQLEKKAEYLKEKAKKRMRKQLIATVAGVCSIAALLYVGKAIYNAAKWR